MRGSAEEVAQDTESDHAPQMSPHSDLNHQSCTRAYGVLQSLTQRPRPAHHFQVDLTAPHCEQQFQAEIGTEHGCRQLCRSPLTELEQTPHRNPRRVNAALHTKHAHLSTTVPASWRSTPGSKTNTQAYSHQGNSYHEHGALCRQHGSQPLGLALRQTPDPCM